MTKPSRSEGAGFGKFPAWVVDKGLLAGLTHTELRLYCVLVRRAWNENRLARFTRRELERLSGVPWRVHAGVDAGLVKWGLVKVWRHGRGKVYFVPLAGPVRGPREADPISPPGNRPHDTDPISPHRDRQGRFEYATRPGDTDPRGPRDADTLNPKETYKESFQSEQDPLSQFRGREDGTKTPDGPLAETVLDELEQAQVRAQEEPAPEEPADLVDAPPLDLSEQDQETLDRAVVHFREAHEPQAIFRVYTQLLDLPLDPRFTPTLLDRAAAKVRQERGWAVA